MQIKKQQLELDMKQWFQIGKEVLQGYILSPCLFNLYAEYIMQNAGLDEAQAGIKIDGRNVNNLRYASLVTQLAMNPPAMQETLVQFQEDPREGIGYPLQYSWASLVAQMVKIGLQCGRPEFNPWVGKIS